MGADCWPWFALRRFFLDIDIFIGLEEVLKRAVKMRKGAEERWSGQDGLRLNAIWTAS